MFSSSKPRCGWRSIPTSKPFIRHRKSSAAPPRCWYSSSWTTKSVNRRFQTAESRKAQRVRTRCAFLLFNLPVPEKLNFSHNLARTELPVKAALPGFAVQFHTGHRGSGKHRRAHARTQLGNQITQDRKSVV